jgi:hypothetical protein
MELETAMHVRGDVDAIISYEDGTEETIAFRNTILTKGCQALAASLAKGFGQEYNYYINRMIFGNGGTDGGGARKFVPPSRQGLFCGTPVVSKPVVSAVDPDMPSQVVFTSVLTVNDANGITLNEMALQMANGELYSMVTFPNLTKTNVMSIVWNWRLSFVG